MPASLKTYYLLTKPGIIRGNVMTAAAGFLFAAQGSINVGQFLALSAGIGLIIASACVYNNYIDRDIDSRMARTKKRALVTGDISVAAALIFATVLGMGGFALLGLFTNRLTVALGIIAMFFYVILYAIFKRRSTLGTVVGSVPGALPLVAGYTAVTATFDEAAALLFVAMVCWQMPHFYAIAIYRLKEYRAARLPVLPAVKGIARTKQYMVLYILGYIACIGWLGMSGYGGYVFSVVMLAMSIWWLSIGLQGFGAKDDVGWAKRVFGSSLLVLLAFSVMLALNAYLP